MLSNLTHAGPRVTLFWALALACDSSARNDTGASDTAPGATKRDALIAPGTWGRATHFQMRASVPEQCALVPDDELDARSRRLSVEVNLKASGDVQVPANPYYALLVDRTNAVYEATLADCNGGLSPTLLEPGQTGHGRLTFDIPKRSAGLTLVYAPALTGAPHEELVFDLGPD